MVADAGRISRASRRLPVNFQDSDRRTPSSGLSSASASCSYVGGRPRPVSHREGRRDGPSAGMYFVSNAGAAPAGPDAHGHERHWLAVEFVLLLPHAASCMPQNEYGRVFVLMLLLRGHLFRRPGCWATCHRCRYPHHARRSLRGSRRGVGEVKGNIRSVIIPRAGLGWDATCP